MARSTSPNLGGARLPAGRSGDRPLDRCQPARLAAPAPVDQEPAGLRGAALRGNGCSTRRRSLAAVAAFAIFCALSGVVYLVNDVADRETRSAAPAQAPAADRRRARCRSPVAIGGGVRARRRRARRARSALGWRFGLVAAAYLALLVLYSGPLKHIVIIDVLTIAIGFVLRAVGRRGGGRRRHQPLAARLHDPAGAVHRARQAAARAGAAGRRRDQPPPDSRRVQPVSARSDDRRGHGVDADRLHLLHDQPGDRAEVRDAPGWA